MSPEMREKINHPYQRTAEENRELKKQYFYPETAPAKIDFLYEEQSQKDGLASQIMVT